MPPRKLGETIWGQISDPDYDWLTPHQNEIEQMFAAAETKAKEEKGADAADKPKKAAKPGMSLSLIIKLSFKTLSHFGSGSVSILEGKRSQNLSILLSRFGKASLEDIRYFYLFIYIYCALYSLLCSDGIIKLDESMFELGTLKALETFVPTDEEMEQIKDYLKTGDIKMLGKAEQFFVLVI